MNMNCESSSFKKVSTTKGNSVQKRLFLPNHMGNGGVGFIFVSKF